MCIWKMYKLHSKYSLKLQNANKSIEHEISFNSCNQLKLYQFKCHFYLFFIFLFEIVFMKYVDYKLTSYNSYFTVNDLSIQWHYQFNLYSCAVNRYGLDNNLQCFHWFWFHCQKINDTKNFYCVTHISGVSFILCQYIRPLNVVLIKIFSD